jgi:hypothetical protein
MSEEIEFTATLPQIQSALSFGAGQARVKLDIPESDKAAALRLAAYGEGKVLRVVVRIEE